MKLQGIVLLILFLLPVPGQVFADECRDRFAELRRWALTEQKEGGHPPFHKVGSTSRGGKVTIAFLQRDQKKFMVLLLRAVREGSVNEIDAGNVVGPKVLALLSHVQKDAEESGRTLLIYGTFDRNELIDRAPKRPSRSKKRFDADYWTESEFADYQKALKDFKIEECERPKGCRFELSIQNGKSTYKIQPK